LPSHPAYNVDNSNTTYSRFTAHNKQHHHHQKKTHPDTYFPKMRLTTSFALGFLMVAVVEAAGAKTDGGVGVMGTMNGETTVQKITKSPLGTKKINCFC
jgi:hypothetical protein